MAMLGLLPSNARISGSVKLGGREILGLKKDELRRVRGSEIAVIFQEPMTALNPGLHRGLPDHRDAAHPHRHHAERGEGRGRSSCSTWSSCPTR